MGTPDGVGRMRVRMMAGAGLTSAAALALGGCSLLGDSAKTAATGPAGRTSAAPPSSFSPLAGPVEAAAALPTKCAQILSTAQLQAVFGAGMPIGDQFGSYAALPGIGRTGRVACVFGVGLDSFGNQSTGSIEVSIATYTGAGDAVGRAADTVRSDEQAGATTAAVSVGGHPATVVVEQTPAGAPSTTAAPSPGASATASAVATAPTTPTTAPPTTIGASPAVAAGETELVMADGNRTFVLQVPLAKLAAQQALTALTRLALEVYQNTMPPVGGSPAPGPSTR